MTKRVRNLGQHQIGMEEIPNQEIVHVLNNLAYLGLDGLQSGIRGQIGGGGTRS